tara:strand:- start:187 stop:657 length:471 start_codon:yes stop_codon:yes gene_type:complete
MAFVENMCIFYTDSGKVIHKDINLRTNNYEPYNLFSTNGELIDYKYIYINNRTISNIKFYKMHHYYIGNKYTSKLLEWKQTKQNDWDWYITDVNKNDLLTVDEYLQLIEEDIQDPKDKLLLAIRKSLKNSIYESNIDIILNTLKKSYETCISNLNI